MSVTDEDVKAALESGAWTEKTDKKTGKTYYVNKATKKTCWDLKKELAKSKGGDAKEDEKKKTDKKEEKAKPEKKEAKKEKEKEPKKEKEKAEKKKEEKSEPAEADRESVASAAKPTNSSSRPKRGSMVSNVSHASNVSRMSAATERTIGGEVQPYTPIIMRSDNPHKGKYMTAVTLEVASKGVVDGPDMVYGFTEKEVKLAASLRREQMRQKYYDRMSLRSYMDDRQGGPRSGSLVEAADYWDGDMLHGGGLPCPDTRRYIAPSNMSQVTDDGGKDGALRAASACGDASGVLRLLKEGGVRVNEPRQDGKTALHHAARHGHLEVIEILLEAGADPLRPDMKGRTAVDMAAQFGQRGAVSLLENRGGGSPGRVRHHWHCSPDRLSPRSATREPSGTVYPTAYPNPVETRRQLTEDVTEAMSGMSMLVKGWINDWGKHPQESIGYPQGYREYRRGPQYDLPSETQKHPAGRISPPRNPRSPGILDELTAHIWAAANNGPQPTNIDTPPAPPPALGATTPTPIRSWGPAADTPPRAPQYPAAQAYLLPSDGRKGCDGKVKIATDDAMNFHGELIPEACEVVCLDDVNNGMPLHGCTVDGWMVPCHGGDLLLIRKDCILKSFTHWKLPKFVPNVDLKIRCSVHVDVIAAVHPLNPNFLPGCFKRALITGSYSRVLAATRERVKSQDFYRFYHARFKPGDHTIVQQDPIGIGRNVYTLFARPADPSLEVKYIPDDFEQPKTYPAWLKPNKKIELPAIMCLPKSTPQSHSEKLLLDIRPNVSAIMGITLSPTPPEPGCLGLGKQAPRQPIKGEELAPQQPPGKKASSPRTSATVIPVVPISPTTPKRLLPSSSCAYSEQAPRWGKLDITKFSAKPNAGT